MKQTISIALALLLAFPAVVFAEDPPPPTVMSIKKDQQAPFAGVLLNTTAAAQLFAERDFSLERCQLRISFELEKERAKYNLLLKNTNASLETMEKKYDSIVSIKDEEIKRLTKLNLEKESDYTVFWATGGFIVGTALTISLFYVATHVTN